MYLSFLYVYFEKKVKNFKLNLFITLSIVIISIRKNILKKISYLSNCKFHPWLIFIFSSDLVTAEPTKNEYPWSFSPTIGDDYVEKNPRKLMEISEFINYEVNINCKNLILFIKYSKLVFLYTANCRHSVFLIPSIT